jgi:hypothetical protein
VIKKVVLSILAVPLLMAGTAVGQSNAKGSSNSRRSLTISGKVSEDGKSVIERNGKSWSVTNPATLAGHQNQPVRVKCQISPDSLDIRVLSVKMEATHINYAVNRGDSAFRR